MLTGRKLLLADDSLTIQKVVSLTFNDEGLEVTAVGGGAEALAELGRSLPDIVLADVFMPEPNGYALCERIKTDERTRHIPVVLLVGTFEPFNEAEARRVGADEVLTKPFQSIRDLVNKVGGLLGGQPEDKPHETEPARDERHEDEATQDLSPFAADARAAEDPAAETLTATDTTTPADAFPHFDMDDATIQMTPASEFDTPHAAPRPGFSEIREEEQFSDRGETEGGFVLVDDDDDDAPAPEAHAAAASSGASFPASSPAASHAATDSSFDAYAARAAEADDALLELGDAAPERSAAGEADDFILDIGDEDSFDSEVAIAAPEPAHDGAAAAEADMFFAEQAQTTEVPEAFAMPEAFTESTPFADPAASSPSQSFVEPGRQASPTAAMPFAQDEDAPVVLAEESSESKSTEISESPSLLFANEPRPGARDAEAATVQDEDRPARQHEPIWDGDPAAASAVAHAGGAAAAAAHVEGAAAAGASQAAESAATGASGTPAASSEPSQASSTAAAPAPAASASSLSPEMMDELVRRVVAHMSNEVVREVAWEVVPDLAERLIKQRLEEEQPRNQ